MAEPNLETLKKAQALFTTRMANPLEWSIREVSEWLSEIDKRYPSSDLKQHIKKFETEAIDGEINFFHLDIFRWLLLRYTFVFK